MFIRVVFPAPFSPRMACIAPLRMRNDTLSRATNPSKVLVTRSMKIWSISERPCHESRPTCIIGRDSRQVPQTGLWLQCTRFHLVGQGQYLGLHRVRNGFMKRADAGGFRRVEIKLV